MEQRHDVALKFNKRQAFFYNRLLSAQALAFLRSEEALSSDVRVEEFFRHLTVRGAAVSSRAPKT